jgi:hypothetical protein
VRLSPVDTSATNWPMVPAPDDRWWVWSSRWNEDWQGKPKYSEKTRPSATLSTINPTWPDLGSNAGRRSGKPATNRLSYGTANFTLPFTFIREMNGSNLGCVTGYPQWGLSWFSPPDKHRNSTSISLQLLPSQSIRWYVAQIKTQPWWIGASELRRNTSFC